MTEPNVVITLIDKKGKEVKMVGKANKIRKRQNASLIKRAKLGFKSLTISVDYGKGFTNSMSCETFSDIKWAIEAFLDKKLWI